MGNNFNYTDIHLFNKDGIELPLIIDSTIKLVLESQHGDDAIYCCVLSKDSKEYSFHCIKEGSRFSKVGDNLVKGYVSVYGSSEIIHCFCKCDLRRVKSASSNSSSDDSYVISKVIDFDESYKDAINNEVHGESTSVGFPSATFSTSITFNKVSTMLAETQSIFILGKNTSKDTSGNVIESFLPINEIDSNFTNNFKLLFFIDTRNQDEFKFFSVNEINDEITWSNKLELDLDKKDDNIYSNNFRINVAFRTQQEGVYSENIIVFLVDKTEKNVTPIGTIEMHAEAIGEDERYQTLFTNFGLPPTNSLAVFNDTDQNEDLVDYQKYNINAKHLFLNYADIFPYVGTYKALINAVSTLGYTDIFFKEWYKEVGKDIPNTGYVSYDMTYGSNKNANLINNLSIDERIKLKKLNWLSMIYKINEEIADHPEDKYGFPQIQKVYGYNDPSIIAKLISLKKWLEKYIIGVNCRIIDVGGEGIYYERYGLDTYGTYQKIIEWNNNDKNLAPDVDLEESETVLVDSSANIFVDINPNSPEHTTLESISDKTFLSFATGVFDTISNLYKRNKSESDKDENLIYAGSTFDFSDRFNTYQIKASSTLDSFIFNDEYILKNDIEKSSSLRVSDDMIKFSPYDLYKGAGQYTIFKNLPIIKIEKGNIRRKSSSWNNVVYRIDTSQKNDDSMSYILSDVINDTSVAFNDYVTLIPPIHTDVKDNDTRVEICPYDEDIAEGFDRVLNETITKSDSSAGPHRIMNKVNTTYGLRYMIDDYYHLPMFMIKSYRFDLKNNKFNNIPRSNEYILEILDGKMIFSDFDDDHNRIIYLNFNFDKNTNKQSIEVNIEYKSDSFSIGEYMDDSNIYNFTYGKKYHSFIENYKNDPEKAISYITSDSNKEFIKPIKVNNTGEFTIDVYALDYYNNIFAAKCHTKPKVFMPQIDMTTYSNSKIGNIAPISKDEVDNITNNFSEFCIYDTNYLITDVSKDSSLSISYPTYSYSLKTPASGDIVNFMDIKDRYKVLAIDQYYNATNSYTDDDSINENYSLIMEKYNKHDYANVVDANNKYAAQLMMSNIDRYDKSNKNVTDYLFAFNDSSLTFTNANVMYFNELGGYPIAQTYGQIANDLAFNLDISNDSSNNDYYSGNYRLAVQDQSDRSYVWCSLKEHSSSKLKKEFKKYIENNYISKDKTTITDILKKLNLKNTSSVYSITYDENNILDNYVNNKFNVIKSENIEINSNDDIVIIQNQLNDSSILNISSDLDNLEYLNKNKNILIDSSDNDIRIAAIGTSQDPNLDREISVEEKFDLCLFRGIDDNFYFNIIKYRAYDLINQTDINSFVKYYTDMYNYVYPENIILTDVYGDVVVNNKSVFDILLNEVLNIKCDDKKTLDSIIKSYLHSSFVLDAEYKYAIVKQMLESIKTNNINEEIGFIAPKFKDNMYISLLDKFIELNGLFKHMNIKLTDKTVDDMKRSSKFERRKYFLDIIKEQINLLADSDEDKSLSAYVTIAFFICTYILERLIDNVKNPAFRGITEKKVTGDISFYLNVFHVFILKTEPNIQSVLYNYFNSIFDSTIKYLLENDDDSSSIYPIGSQSIYKSLNYNNTYLKDLIEYYSDETCNMYDKMLANYSMNVMLHYDKNDISVGIIPDNIVTKGKLQIHSNNSKRNYKDLLYAVTSKNIRNTKERLYVKSLNYLNDGYTTVSKNMSHNALPKIDNVLSKDYVSLYIRPTWDIRVNVSLIENYKDLGLEVPNNNYDKYLLLTYYTVAFIPIFNIGDIVKISFKNLLVSDYIGQASYEVVARTNSKYSFIVKGNINDAYLSKDNEDVWVPCALKPCPFDIYKKFNNRHYIIDEEEENFYKNIDKTQLNVIQYVEREVSMFDIDTSSSYFKPVNGSKHSITVLEEIKCIENPKDGGIKVSDKNGIELESNKQPNVIMLKKICGITENGIMPAVIHISASTSERVIMTLSYAHHAYVNYPVEVNDAHEDILGMTHINFEDTNLIKKYLDFVDTTFGVTITNFNINEGVNAWMNYEDPAGKLPIPNILNSDVYEYKNHSLELIRDKSNNIVFKALLNGSDDSYAYTYWRVYKMTDISNEHKFMFDSYNKYLYLDYNDKGIYDIEANVYDKYGNKSTRMFKGAYIIK